MTITEGRYYLSFKDGRGKQKNIEIDEMLYQTFDRFELEDIVLESIEYEQLHQEVSKLPKGLGGVAKYLNLQGIKKIPRQNGKLETWSSHLIRQILDNPVYCGKIAYGRRTREKVKGTKNEYEQIHTDDYILEDGQHEGIVSEELWQKVHAKRAVTGIKQPSKIGKDKSHLYGK